MSKSKSSRASSGRVVEGLVASSQAQLPILIAEDNPVNQKLALRQLNHLGYVGEIAANGQEALSALARKRFALILMDIHMPEMDGIEATRRIREVGTIDEGTLPRHIPIIALTASTLAEERNACFAAGMNDFLKKPASLNELGTVIRRHLTNVRSYDHEICPSEAAIGR